MASAWFISRMVLNFLSDFFLLIQQLCRMVMFNFCIFWNLLKFFPVVFYYHFLVLESVFYSCSLLHELSFVLYYHGAWEALYGCWGQQCIQQLFGSVLQKSVRSVCSQCSNFYSRWPLFCCVSCYLDGIYHRPFSPSVLPGCLLGSSVRYMYIHNVFLDRWALSLLAGAPL